MNLPFREVNKLQLGKELVAEFGGGTWQIGWGRGRGEMHVNRLDGRLDEDKVRKVVDAHVPVAPVKPRPPREKWDAAVTLDDKLEAIASILGLK